MYAFTTFRQRKSPRLRGYDYSQSGAYFVTICCHERQPFFGQIVAGEMVLNETGMLASQCWIDQPGHFPALELDLWVMMPNHMHGILILTDPAAILPTPPDHPTASNPNHTPAGSTRPSLGSIINTYKGAVTRSERLRRAEPELRLWQGRYHDHIIRSAADLERIRAYVMANPACWQQDVFYAE